MPTVTKPRPKPARSVLKDLEQLEAEVTERRIKCEKLRKEVLDLHAALEPLHEERRTLALRQPELFDYEGRPDASVKPNRVLDIDKAIAASPDLDDLRAQLAHAESVLARAEQGAKDWREARYEELIDAHRPMAEEVRDAVIAADQQLQDAIERYLALAIRLESFSEAKHPALRGLVQVPGRDYVGSLLRGRERIEPPIPIPDVSRLPKAEH